MAHGVHRRELAGGVVFRGSVEAIRGGAFCPAMAARGTPPLARRCP